MCWTCLVTTCQRTTRNDADTLRDVCSTFSGARRHISAPAAIAARATVMVPCPYPSALTTAMVRERVRARAIAMLSSPTARGPGRCRSLDHAGGGPDENTFHMAGWSARLGTSERSRPHEATLAMSLTYQPVPDLLDPGSIAGQPCDWLRCAHPDVCPQAGPGVARGARSGA